MSNAPRAAETALVEAARAYLRARGYRAAGPYRLALDFDGGDLVEPPTVILRPVGPIATALVPNAFQRAVLKALAGVGLRTDALAAKVGDRRRLFRDPGGLPELQEADKVRHHPRVGYWRPDDPPPELRTEPEEVA